MFGFDQQMQFANAMMSSFNEAANSMMQASLSAWLPPPKPDPAKSWYKAPRPTAEFQGWTNPAASLMPAPWNAMATSFGFMTPGSPQAAQAWSGLAQFAQGMAALQPIQSFWMSMLPTAQPAQQSQPMAMWQSMMWPVAQFTAMMAAPATTYSAYRSDGGHATAQILFPGQSQAGWNTKALH